MSDRIPAVETPALEFDSHNVSAAASLQNYRIRQYQAFHGAVLALCLVVLAVSFFLQIGASGRVALAGWPRLELPVTCGSRALFGVQCPGCGLTRSFIALAAGDVAGSLRYHRVGWLVALAVFLQVPYRLFTLIELRTRLVQRQWPVWCGWTLLAILVVNWLANSAGL
jgi:hypothetical protein